MGRSKPDEWWVLLDESGRFEDPDDDTCVAGVAVKASARGCSSGAVGASLSRALPYVPTPLHAWLLETPVIIALWCEVEPPPEPLAAICRRVVVKLRQHSPTDLNHALQAVERGADPQKDVLCRLNRVGRRLQEYGTLCDRVAEVRAAVAQLGRRLAEGAAGGLLLVASGETVPDSAEGNADERYAAHLRSVVQRVVDGGPDRHVLVVPATRNVTAEELAVQIPMRSIDVQRALTGIRTRGASRALAADTPPRYGATVDARIVLADWAAYAARQAFRGGFGLDRTLSQLESSTGLPVRIAEDALPSVAAVGWADAEVDRARSGAAPTMAPPDAHEWAVEQARKWATHIRTRRGD